VYSDDDNDDDDMNSISDGDNVDIGTHYVQYFPLACDEGINMYIIFCLSVLCHHKENQSC